LRAGAVGLALLVAATAQAHKPTTTKFTYHRDVYPIVVEKCGSCHRPGGVGPMSLLSYKEAHPWAVSIKNEVLGLRMPPWFADERYGELKHASSLSATEVNTIVDWCLGGTPEGDPNAQPTMASPADWELGEPDLVLAIPEEIVLGPDESEAVRDVRLSTGFGRERWMKALDVRPGSPSVVRSVLVFRERASPENVIAVWIPGEEPEVLPEGRGMRLPKHASLVVRVHYKKTWLDEGKEVSDLSQIGLYLEEGKREAAVGTIVVKSFVRNPDEEGFVATVLEELPERVDVLAIFPWVDSGLTSFQAEAVLPGGETRNLIRLREVHPDWPRKFWLEAPLALPARSRIRVTLTASDEETLLGPHALLLDVMRE
jgi:hypothetical protein